MNNYKIGLLIFIAVLVVGFNVGYNISQAMFFGGLTLVGLIVLVESISPLKWLLSRSSKLFDILIFVFTILATISYGLTVAASLTVAGLGYTLFYGPYLREKRVDKPKKNKPVGNHSTNFNWK